MNRSVWDDDKCRCIWKNLVMDNPYSWKEGKKKPEQTVVGKKLLHIANIPPTSLSRYLGQDIDSARNLRRLVGNILAGAEDNSAIEIAHWIVSQWGGIHSGKDVISDWVKDLRPFSSESIHSFINVHGNNRISSWSKILAFSDFERHAIYDSRTAVALNCAMILSESRPVFLMPMSQKGARNECIKYIKNKSDALTGGYYEYLYVLGRFVELGYTDSLLSAERQLFSGADKTMAKMMNKVGLI